MNKHTPGPWEVHPLAPLAVHQPEYECWIPQSKADARLIAAAPELLEALQAIVNSAAANQAAVIYPLIDDARAAIAKATGEQA
jgi:hypothetical protein